MYLFARLGMAVPFVDVAANHGDAIGVRVFRNRQDLVADVAARGWIEAVRAFHHVPAVVAALLQDVDFFPAILANVGDEEAAADGLQGKAPGIAQPVGKDLGEPLPPTKGLSAGIAYCRPPRKRRIHSDAEHLPQQREQVLCRC